METKIDKMVKYAEWACRDANIGYDQANRWDLPEYGNNTYAGETDCSALTYQAAIFAGYNLPTSGTRYTGTVLRDFQNAGFKALTWQNVGAEKNLKKGDVLYKEGHVAIWTGSAIAEAYGDENGNAKYGQAGDQKNDTPYGETRLSGYRSGWTWVLRPPEEKEPVRWPQNPSDDMKPVDFIIEEGSNNVAITSTDKQEYSYRYEKWASGKLVVYVTDFFNGTSAQTKAKYYYGSYYLDKTFEFPNEIQFVEAPRIICGPVKAGSNLLSIQIYDISETQFGFWIYSDSNSNIPRTSIDIVLVGSWK